MKKSEMGNNNALRYTGIIILLVVFFSLGFVFGKVGRVSVNSYGKENFNLFWQVWDTLKTEYVDQESVDEEKMYYGAIKGMVDSIGDAATTYLNPEETETFNKSMEGKTFEGIGAELGYDKGMIVVVSPIKGSPAQKSGIKAGDIILQVDGKDIKKNESIYDVVSKIRGESGTEVELTVLHKGEANVTKIKIIRGEIDVPSIEVKKIENDISIIRISRFTDESVGRWNNNWDSAVKEVANSKGLIIDLRGNPGGYFDSAIYAGNEFLPKGAILAKQEDKKGRQDVFRVTRNGLLKDIPLVVIVDNGSASASEIFAGAMQQNDRAQVIGVSTYGKGTAQNILSFSDGSSLHLTIMKWLLPDGNWLNKDNTIKPDIEVEYSEDDFKEGNDIQSKKAVEVLLKK